mgnify:CR=1 FL=1
MNVTLPKPNTAPPPNVLRGRLWTRAIWVGMIVMLIWATFGTELSVQKFFSGLAESGKLLFGTAERPDSGFFPPDFRRGWQFFEEMILTIKMAIWGTVLAAVVLAAVSGSLRSPGTPTPGEVTAIVASGVACTVVVVTLALASSVRRPHRADLSGPRDAVAPPGALALASLRLAVPTALVGILLGSSLQFGAWWWPLVVALPPLLLCWLSLRRTFARYADPVVRARVVQVVAAG